MPQVKKKIIKKGKIYSQRQADNLIQQAKERAYMYCLNMTRDIQKTHQKKPADGLKILESAISSLVWGSNPKKYPNLKP